MNVQGSVRAAGMTVCCVCRWRGSSACWGRRCVSVCASSLTSVRWSRRRPPSLRPAASRPPRPPAEPGPPASLCLWPSEHLWTQLLISRPRSGWWEGHTMWRSCDMTCALRVRLWFCLKTSADQQRLPYFHAGMNLMGWCLLSRLFLKPSAWTLIEQFFIHLVFLHRVMSNFSRVIKTNHVLTKCAPVFVCFYVCVSHKPKSTLS